LYPALKNTLLGLETIHNGQKVKITWKRFVRHLWGNKKACAYNADSLIVHNALDKGKVVPVLNHALSHENISIA
jgi:hypothetical protein